MFVDPSQFLRNERIFLMWLRTAITVGGLATGELHGGGVAAGRRMTGLLGVSSTAHNLMLKSA